MEIVFTDEEMEKIGQRAEIRNMTPEEWVKHCLGFADFVFKCGQENDPIPFNAVQCYFHMANPTKEDLEWAENLPENLV